MLSYPSFSNSLSVPLYVKYKSLTAWNCDGLYQMLFNGAGRAKGDEGVSRKRCVQALVLRNRSNEAYAFSGLYFLEPGIK